MSQTNRDAFTKERKTLEIYPLFTTSALIPLKISLDVNFLSAFSGVNFAASFSRP
jgi:hypothetical protein